MASVSSEPRQARYQPLVIVLAVVCAGIVADRSWPLPLAAWWLAAAAAWAAWWAPWRRGRLRLAATMLLLAAAATAASWRHCRWELFAADDLGHFARQTAQPVCVEVRAVKSPREVPPPPPDPMAFAGQGRRVRIDVELLAVRDGARWRPASGRAGLLVEGALPDVQAGDRLQVFAQLTAPSPGAQPGRRRPGRKPPRPTRSSPSFARSSPNRSPCSSTVRAGARTMAGTRSRGGQ